MSSKTIDTIEEEPEDSQIVEIKRMKSIGVFNSSPKKYEFIPEDLSSTPKEYGLKFISVSSESISSSILHKSEKSEYLPEESEHDFAHSEENHAFEEGVEFQRNVDLDDDIEFEEHLEIEQLINIRETDENLTTQVEDELEDDSIDEEIGEHISEFRKLPVIEEVGLADEEEIDRKVHHEDTFKVPFESHNHKSGFEKEQCNVCKYCRVIGNEILQFHAQEPWPNDVRLFQPYEVEQILLPDNANCLAVQTFLKMCNLDYKVDARPNAEAMSPTGKVPFIKCGAFIVAELEGIVQFVANKGITLTQDLSTENKSDMRAYMTLVNNVLGNAEMYICWQDQETYQEVTKTRFGSIYPWPLNHIQAWCKRSSELKRLKVLGWLEKSLEEVYTDVETCCQALTDRLDGNEYFFGSKFTELDALVYAHLYLMLTVPLPAHLGLIVKTFPGLVEFCQNIDRRVMQRYTDLTPVLRRKSPENRVIFTGSAERVFDQEETEIDKIVYSESNFSVNLQRNIK